MIGIMLTWFPCDSRSHSIFQIQSKARQRWEVSPNWRLRKGAGEVPPRQKGPCPHPSSPSTQPGLLPLIKQDLGPCSLMLPAKDTKDTVSAGPSLHRAFFSQPQPPPSTQPSGPPPPAKYTKIHYSRSFLSRTWGKKQGRNRRKEFRQQEREGRNKPFSSIFLPVPCSGPLDAPFYKQGSSHLERWSNFQDHTADLCQS